MTASAWRLCEPTRSVFSVYEDALARRVSERRLRYIILDAAR
jgi:hypothetical protein